MIPKTMKAIQLTKTGEAAVLSTLSEVPIPQPGKGEVLIRNKFAGINYIDTYQRSGLYPVQLPLILGREGAGEIAALGGEVDGSHGYELKVGDRVAYLAPASYAEYTVVPATHVLRLPDFVNLEQGAAMLLQGMTAAYLVYDSYCVQPKDWVLVPAAAGGTGSLICQLASAAGGIVIGLVGSEEKGKLARAHGATHIINYKENTNWSAEVMRITEGRGVQVAYDGVGAAIYKQILSCMAKRGSYINFGNASGIIEVGPFDLTPKCLRLMRPALFHYAETREEFLQLADIVLKALQKGKLRLEIHRTYDLKDAAQAHMDLEGRRTTGKLLLKL